MNPFLNFEGDEQILRQERLHPGVFALPVLLFLGLLIPMLPLIYGLRAIASLARQFSPERAHGIPSLFWLFLILTCAMPVLIYTCVILVAYLNCQVTLTNKRLMYRTGFLARMAGEVALENVDAMLAKSIC